MKRSLIYTILMSLLLTMGSCDKYLDITPVGKVIPTTAEEFRDLITEGYSNVPDDRGLADMRSDEVRLDATTSSNDLDSYFDIWNWNDYGANENTSTFSWRQYYHVLFIANYVIENEHKIKNGTADEIRQMVGECYMLRAYMHFVLANLHAPAYTKCDPATTKAVPLKLDSDVEKLLPRDMLSDIYKYVVADLDSAEKYLNVDEWPMGYNYRFNKLSVDALRSRVYLYMGLWGESLAAAQRVLEVKSELADVAAQLPNEYNSVESIVALEQNWTAQRARSVKVDNDFFARYNSNDLRRLRYYKRETRSNIILLKGGSNTYSSTLRVGEMYLNAAEAAWHSNNFTAAADYLLALQSKRYNDAGYTAKEAEVRAMTNAELLEEILNERSLELAFEGHRWFDLRRTTQPRLTRSFKDVEYVLEQGDARYTIRIPTAAIEANPLLAD